jgi:hypothetical protein
MEGVSLAPSMTVSTTVFEPHGEDKERACLELRVTLAPPLGERRRGLAPVCVKK